MFTIIKRVVAAGLIGIGALAAVPASAQADGFYFGIGGGHPGAGIYFHYGPPAWHSRPPVWHRQTCTPRRAVWKAERMGVRHAHVRRVNARVIVVRGRDHYGPVVIRFARAPGCPVVGWR
jgi:hypothetical protein